jgi:parallel beta-helix repeat protein
MRNEKKLFRLKKIVSVFCIVFCLLLALPSRFELSAKAGSTSVTVSPSESIQAAINNATAGDTILVSAGMYNESLHINKSISLIGEDRDRTIINGQNNQFIVSIMAENVTIQGFTIECTLNLDPSSGIGMFLSKGSTISNDIVENSQQGINLTSSNNNTILGNIITNTQQGIAFWSSLINTVSDNVITANSQGGIALTTSTNNLFSGNVISNNYGNYGGIYMYASGGNVFSGNTVANNYPVGETISLYCYLNTFYDNNFYEAFQVSNNSINIWDYGGQGNYWSNYAGHDRGDGIGIESYAVAPSNRDNHPLMGKFSSFTATFVGEPYQVSVISNSTISGFEFEVGIETGNEIIQFNVTGVEGTVGFSRIAIPTGLMTTSVIVLVGEREIAPTWLNGQNTAFNYLYLTYSSRSQTILIISSITLDLYDQLLEEFLTLNATYYVLLSNYTTQFGILSNETAQFGLLSNYVAQLNNTYNGLLSNYASLLGNYSQLQQRYQDLNASYQQHLSDDNQNLQNVRSLMYIFAAGTAVLIVATVYFSKRMYSRSKEAPEKREAILSQPANSAVYNLV